MHQPFAMFARYNEWANRRVYEAVAKLPDEAFRADGGAFFGSIHRTLNHILVADRIWMHRFTGSGEAPDRLDAVLFDDFVGLRAARAAEDQRIIGWVDGLAPEHFVSPLRYRTLTSPDPIEQPLAPVLFHVFNHQTHHRGQVHGLLTALAGREAGPALDLVLFQRQTGTGMS
jgi:uncharacterized damage-inducible protein DinB